MARGKNTSEYATLMSQIRTLTKQVEQITAITKQVEGVIIKQVEIIRQQETFNVLTNMRQQIYDALMNDFSGLIKIHVDDIANDIKNKIKTFGLTPLNLGFDIDDKTKKGGKIRVKPKPKYRDPVSGKTWSGRGKEPLWMKEALAKGISKEHFALNS